MNLKKANEYLRRLLFPFLVRIHFQKLFLVLITLCFFPTYNLGHSRSWKFITEGGRLWRPPWQITTTSWHAQYAKYPPHSTREKGILNSKANPPVTNRWFMLDTKQYTANQFSYLLCFTYRVKPSPKLQSNDNYYLQSWCTNQFINRDFVKT